MMTAGNACWIAGISVDVPELNEFRHELDAIVTASYPLVMSSAEAGPALAGVQAQLAMRRWIDAHFSAEQPPTPGASGVTSG